MNVFWLEDFGFKGDMTWTDVFMVKILLLNR